MAGIRINKLKDDTESYLVYWRQGGRLGTRESETFSNKARAEGFKLDVERAGNRWPEGWEKGHGYKSLLPDDGPDGPKTTPFLPYALGFIDRLTRAAPDTKERYRQQARDWHNETAKLKGVDVVTIEGLTQNDLADWMIWRGSLGRGGSAKTIANYHGLIYQVFEHAKVEDNLITKNPCAASQLPKSELDDDAEEVDNVFLSESQWWLIYEAMHPDSKDFITVLVGTGLRFSELTALHPEDLYFDGAKHLWVRRAWKRVGSEEDMKKKKNVKLHSNGRFYIGRPKSKKSKRRVPLSPTVAEVLRRNAAMKAYDAYVFTSPLGQPVDHSHFMRDRWHKALDKAQKNGLTVRPRIHDLRHTYAAWLITANVPLPEIQARLGHDSIVTTVDTYGGLLIVASDVADAAIEAALSGQSITLQTTQLRSVS